MPLPSLGPIPLKKCRQTAWKGLKGATATKAMSFCAMLVEEEGEEGEWRRRRRRRRQSVSQLPCTQRYIREYFCVLPGSSINSLCMLGLGFVPSLAIICDKSVQAFPHFSYCKRQKLGVEAWEQGYLSCTMHSEDIDINPVHTWMEQHHLILHQSIVGSNFMHNVTSHHYRYMHT